MSVLLKQQLVDYARRHTDNYSDYFKKCCCFYLFEYYEEHGDIELLNCMKAQQHTLQQLHAIFEEEIHKLFSYANEKGIPLVS